MILPSTYITSISLPSLCNSNILLYVLGGIIEKYYNYREMSGREIEVLYVLGSIIQKY
jgi:hypothetical protein